MNRLTLLAAQVGVGLLILLAWHLVTVYPLLGNPKNIQFFFSTPLDVLSRVAKEFGTADIWRHLFITLQETVLAFLLGAGGGIAFGFLLARNDILARVF